MGNSYDDPENQQSVWNPEANPNATDEDDLYCPNATEGDYRSWAYTLPTVEPILCSDQEGTLYPPDGHSNYGCEPGDVPFDTNPPMPELPVPYDGPSVRADDRTPEQKQADAEKERMRREEICDDINANGGSCPQPGPVLPDRPDEKGEPYEPTPQLKPVGD